MGKKISIIIPAYNEEEKLSALIDSVEKQTVRPFEAILVDDCSTDNTREIASKNFKVISTPRNMGPAAARNLGMQYAKGDYFAFLDADCRPNPDWLANVEKQIDANNADVITGGYAVEASTFIGKSIGALGFPCGGSIGFEKMWPVAKDGTVEKISTGNFIIPKSVIQKTGGFDESFTYCYEDAWFTHQLVESGVKIKFCPDINVNHTARETLKSFIHWHYSRGKGLNLFKEKVGKLNRYYKLRIWSTKNIIKAYYTDIKFPVIMSLLVLSVILQKVACLVDKWDKRKCKEV